MGQTSQWYYRGSLKSCNYACSYCPFSKKKSSIRQLEEDKYNLFRFIEELENRFFAQNKKEMAAFVEKTSKNVDNLSSLEVFGDWVKHKCGVQIVPYGEALIHRYYWEGLAKLSQNPAIAAVGAQSNFSFPVEEMLKVYRQQGGDITKLRLWGTFHPEMTSVTNFLSQCRKLSEHQVQYCVGAVGVPEQLPLIIKLRKQLPSSVYLWINKMDGLRRNYTEKEIEEFLAIDEYFELELKHHRVYRREIEKEEMFMKHSFFYETPCEGNVFVEANGQMRRCNICKTSIGNFYAKTCEDILFNESGSHDDGEENHWIMNEYSENREKNHQLKNKSKENRATFVCSNKECSCYLAYCNRLKEELLFFQPYPAFRIPDYKKAVFFDVDGTLVPEGQTQISEETSKRVAALAKHSDIYLVTSLPYEIAIRKVKGIRLVLAGGVFANGGRCKIIKQGQEKDILFPLETSWLYKLEAIKEQYGFTVHIYQKGEVVYKVTLAFPKKRNVKRGKNESENACYTTKNIAEKVISLLQLPKDYKITTEENCIQITAAGTSKLQGILKVCSIMGYGKEEVAVIGNSDNDEEMLSYFPFSAAVKGSSEKAGKAAKVRL